LVEEIDFPDGKLRNHDVNSDRGGSYLGPGMAGRQKHGYTPPFSTEEQLALEFARHLAHRMDEGRNKKEFLNLMIVADPHFLGLIRHCLSKPTTACVVETISKDLSWVKDFDIPEHLEVQLKTFDSDVTRSRVA
jgi:protein required for attachment to host cells